MSSVKLVCCNCLCSNQAYIENLKDSLEFDDLAFHPQVAHDLSDMMFICNACFSLNIFKFDQVEGNHYTTILNLEEEE